MNCRKTGILVAALALLLPAAGRGEDIRNQGEVRAIEFVLPFERALAQAQKENRLILLKPIYGGVDQLGEREYRCGSW